MRQGKWLEQLRQELAALKGRLLLGRAVRSGGIQERHHLLTELTWALRRQGKAVLIYIDLVQFHQVAQLRGLEWAARLITFIKKNIPVEVSQLFTQKKLIAAQHLWADDFVILLADGEKSDLDYYWNMCYILRLRLKDAVSRTWGRQPGVELELHLGFSIIDREDPLPVEMLYYNALRQARLMAKGARQWHMVKLGEQFKEMLAGEKIRTLYQPIVSLQDGTVIGWEALSRGDVQSELGRPDLFFQLAEEMGMLFQAEKICRNLAISRIGPLEAGQRIFLNVHPRTLADPLFVRGETFRLLQERNLKPENVVIEVTEKHSLQGDGELARAVEHYRQQGYQVAIDDVGAGYSGLSSIALLRPDYLKIDMSLIRNIDQDGVKRAIVEVLVLLADKINCRVVAEGIETESELATLMAMGVHYGQGYFLARPDFPSPAPAPAVRSIIQKYGGLLREQSIVGSPVGEIVQEALVVKDDERVEKVKALLEKAGHHVQSVVVVRDSVPVGLIMKQKLYQILCSQYGAPIYSKRPIRTIMDSAPLKVEKHTPLEQVVQQATMRHAVSLYDDVIVLSGGALLGVVTVQRLLEHLNKNQLEFFKNANPLTGLPGNLVIENYLQLCARENRSCTVIWADLDNFKAYNDNYGFAAGDRMIVLLSKILRHVTRKYGGRGRFVGHIGGDDFIMVVSPERAELTAQKAIALFERLKKPLFHQEDWSRGGYVVRDRRQQVSFCPLVCLSLAMADCRDDSCYENLPRLAVELKKYAKSLPGSVYVRNRRSCAVSAEKCYG